MVVGEKAEVYVWVTARPTNTMRGASPSRGAGGAAGGWTPFGMIS